MKLDQTAEGTSPAKHNPVKTALQPKKFDQVKG